jgi:molybdopterin molybdotransferase
VQDAPFVFWGREQLHGICLYAPTSNRIHCMSSDLLSYAEAAALVARCTSRLGQTRRAVERVALESAQGRVLASPLLADADQPPFPRSTRDGFACRAAEITGQGSLPIAGTTRAGETPAGELPEGAAWEIMTGAPVPPGADCVVMLEHVATENGNLSLAPGRRISAGENIVSQGAQAREGDEILPAGTSITFAQIALAAACGHEKLEVFARPRVAILSTGDEIVPVSSTPGPAQIRNSNGPMLAAMVTAAGGEPLVLPITPDEAGALNAAISQARHADMLLVTGGVSAGKFDLVEPALARASAQFHFTGVRIQPGKPLVFGELKRADGTGTIPFFGLPGNPVSSAVTFLLFAAPVLAALAGGRENGPHFVLARLGRETGKQSKGGLTRFLPARCSFGNDGELPIVELVPWHGSGDIAAMARANCFLVLDDESSHPKPGEMVRILII